MVSENPRHRLDNRRSAALALALLAWAGAGVSRAAVPPSRAGGAGCVEGPTRLCLEGRFEIEATWLDREGREHAALAVALPASGGAAAFSFFDGDSVDLLVRLDGGDIQAVGLTGAAASVQVADRLTGAHWTRSVPAPADADRETLREREPSAFGACDVPFAHCLLDGRFALRVALTDAQGHASQARPVAGGGTTALFASRADGAVDVAVRVIDDRRTGGVTLSYGALAESELAIEIVDRRSGNSRRLVKPAGGPASALEREALSASAAVVRATLDPARAVTAALGPAGGALEVIDERGTRFRLTVPKNSLISTQDVTLTPVATLDGLPFSGGLAGAVYLEPAGLVLSESARLTVTPSPALARAQQLTFAFRGLAGELALVPPIAGATPLVLPVHRFGGYGVGAGTAADLAAQLQRLPTRPQDRLLQKLAGLILPLRRAGSTATALPPAVLQLLQQDFTASVKASLLKLKQGNLEANYPLVRNWQNTAQDTGLSAKLQPQLTEIQNAEIAGGVASYNAAAGAAVSSGAAVEAAASRPCKSVAAAAQMFRAYALLRARGKEAQVLRSKLNDCAHFNLKWNTLLDWRPPGAPNIHQDVEAGASLNLDQNAFSTFIGVRTAKVNEERVTQPACNAYFAIEKVGAATPAVALFELRIPAFSWSDEPLSELTPSLYYQFDPGANQDWRITCTQSYPPLPPFGPITADFHISWTGNYAFFHSTEVAGHGFRARLGRSASPSVYAEKVYNQGSEIEFFEEHTLMSVFFAPR